LHGGTLSITREAVLNSSIAKSNKKFLDEIRRRIRDLVQRGMGDAEMAYKLLEAANSAIVNRLKSDRPTTSTKLQLLRDILLSVQEIHLDSNENRIASACMNIVLFLVEFIKASDIHAMGSPPASAEEWLAQFLSGYLAEANQDMIDRAIAILGGLPAMTADPQLQEKGDELAELANESLTLTAPQKTALSEQCRRIFGLNFRS
jgi:hypothetical protein